jgi:hypothetical protein
VESNGSRKSKIASQHKENGQDKINKVNDETDTKVKMIEKETAKEIAEHERNAKIAK